MTLAVDRFRSTRYTPHSVYTIWSCSPCYSTQVSFVTANTSTRPMHALQLLLYFSFSLSLVMAQNEFTIYEIGIPDNSTIVAGSSFKSTVTSTQSSSYDVTVGKLLVVNFIADQLTLAIMKAHFASFELVAGPKDLGDHVVDIMGTLIGRFLHPTDLTT
jgi:hypothetical protein